MNYNDLMLAFRGQDPYSNDPMGGMAQERPDLAGDFAMMQDAGWFPQRGSEQGMNNMLSSILSTPQRTAMTGDTGSIAGSLGNAETVAKQKNQLNELFQGAIAGQDLDKAARLAVTPEQRAMLTVAEGQSLIDRENRGKQAKAESDRRGMRDKFVAPPTNLMGDYRKMQELQLNQGNARQDRMMKIGKYNSDLKHTDAQTEKYLAEAQNANLKPIPSAIPMSKSKEAFTNEIAKLDAKELDDMRNASLKAQNGIQRVQQMRQLADSGVYSGSFAEGRVGVANFFDTLGIPMDKKLVNSQEYLKHAKELTLSLLKEGVGTNQISNADLAFVNQTVPQLETNPEARKNLLNFIENKLQTSVDRFGKADEFARENGGLKGFKYQTQGNTENAPNTSGKIRKYNPATGKIE